MSKDWRIIVSGEWFYGTREECLRERAEFESTFTEEDFKDHEPVFPELIHSSPPAPSISDDELLAMANKAFGKVVDYDLMGNPITDYRVLTIGAYGPAVRRIVELARQYPRFPDLDMLQAAVDRQGEEIARLKEVTNFKDAVACVFDNLKMVAANTRSREWDDQLEELAEEVIEFAPEYKKQWRDICTLQADLRSANADKEAYAQNAIDLRKRLAKAYLLLQNTGMPNSEIDQILSN